MDAGVGWSIIGVLSGVRTREQLGKAPHRHLIESVAALPMALGL